MRRIYLIMLWLLPVVATAQKAQIGVGLAHTIDFSNIQVTPENGTKIESQNSPRIMVTAKFKPNIEGLHFRIGAGYQRFAFDEKSEDRKETWQVKSNEFQLIPALGFGVLDYLELSLGFNLIYQNLIENSREDKVDFKQSSLDFNPFYQVDLLMGNFSVFAGFQHSLFSKIYTRAQKENSYEVIRAYIYTGIAYYFDYD